MDPNRIITAPNRDEWLRNRGFGGTTAAAILNGREWSAWAALLPDADRSDSSSAILEEGQRFEPYMLSEYQSATGRAAERLTLSIVRHAEHPWATASPDALVPSVSAAEGGAETKTWRLRGAAWGPTGTTIDRYSVDAEDLAPRDYLVQCYWYLEVTGLPWWDLIAWIPQPWGFPQLRVIRVMADRAHQRRMLARVAEWRFEHVLMGKPPKSDLSDECRKQIGRINAPSDKDVTVATSEQAALIADLAAARSRKSAAESEIAGIEVRLAEAMGTTYGVRIGSDKKSPKCLWVTSKGRNSVDMDLVRERVPEAIREGSPSRRFMLYGFKEES